MGKVFTLQPTKSIIQDCLDDIITELGKTVRLVFPGKEVACPDCNGATVGQSTGGGVFGRHGGQLAIPGVICPFCNGRGRRLEEQSRDLVMKCEWTPKHFAKPFPGVNLRKRFSVVETKFFQSDLPDVLRADRLIAQLPMEGLVHQTFTLSGVPGDPSNIIQDRYCICYWETTE